MKIPVDPPQPNEAEIMAFHRRCERFYPPDASDAPIDAQRGWYDAMCLEFEAPAPADLSVSDGLFGNVRTRRYLPGALVREGATVLYLHGGGFVFGSLESHHSICAELAGTLRAELVAVDYRLAPEHPHPAASEDGMAVLNALLRERRRIVLAGDSAGGNLAAGLALRATRERLSGIVGQALIYPALGGDLVSGSYAEMAQAPGLTTADVGLYRTFYGAPEDDAVAHPLKAESLDGLPPAYITVAHFDPLRDDGRRYAARLAEAGVDVMFREEPQMIHAWLRARHMSPGAHRGFRALCQGIDALLRG